MGLCQSILYEDEDDKILRLRHKAQQKELREFQKQLRKQKCQISELDLSGRPRQKEQPISEPKEPPTSEQIKIATDIVYDA